VGRREQIIEAAARVMSKRGVDGVRLVDVAREADVSIGLIQHYFESREHLLAATFESFNDGFIRDWEEAAREHPDPVEGLAMLLHLSVFERDDWRELWWPLWVEFWSISLRDERFRRQYEVIYDKWKNPFRQAIVAGTSQGVFAPTASIDDVVDGLTARIEGLRVQALLEPTRMPRERMFEIIIGSVEQDLGCTLQLDLDRAAGEPQKA
jgi:AcrR family transcriptional regulator